MGQRKRYTSEEKVKILREVLEDGKPVSQAAEEQGIHPNLILNWRGERSSRSGCLRERRRPSRSNGLTIAGKPPGGGSKNLKGSCGKKTMSLPSLHGKF
jgi:transposase-like protein